MHRQNKKPMLGPDSITLSAASPRPRTSILESKASHPTLAVCAHAPSQTTLSSGASPATFASPSDAPFAVNEPATIVSSAGPDVESAPSFAVSPKFEQTNRGRIERIGAILFRAACRIQLAIAAPKPVVTASLTENQRRTLQVISDLQSAAPHQILRLGDISRASLGRDLKALLALGLVSRAGNTRHVRYELSSR